MIKRLWFLGLSLIIWTAPIFSQAKLVTESCYLPEGREINCFPTDKKSLSTLLYVLDKLEYFYPIAMYQADIEGVQAAVINGEAAVIHDARYLVPIEEQFDASWKISAQLLQAIFAAIMYNELGSIENCEQMWADSERFIGHGLSILGAESININTSLARGLYPVKGNTTKRINSIRSSFLNSEAEKEQSVIVTKFNSPDLDYEARHTGGYYQRLVKSATFPIIGDYWDSGYSLGEVLYAEGSWYAFFHQQAGNFKTQAMRLRDKFPEKDIKEFWDKDHDVSSIDFLNDTWYLCITKFENDAEQLWRTRKLFPEKEIAEQWDKGYCIMDLSYGNGLYSLLMNKKPKGYYSQTWFIRDAFPEGEINEYWGKGFQITELDYLNNQWVMVMTKYATRNPQKWLVRSTFPYEELEQLANDQYLVEHFTYSKGQWVFVLNLNQKN